MCYSGPAAPAATGLFIAVENGTKISDALRNLSRPNRANWYNELKYC